MTKNTNPDPIKSYLAGRQLAEQADALKTEIKQHRKAVEEAEKRLTESSKAHRDAARAQARRAQFVGEIFLQLATDNPVMWTDFRPHLDTALEAAGDDLRALFGLPKKPVVAGESLPVTEQVDPPVGDRRDDESVSQSSDEKTHETAPRN